MKRTLYCGAVIAVVIVSARGGLARGAEPVLTGCLVKLQDDVKLPAKEAGVLVYLGVREGDQVREGADVARVDESEPRMQKKVAEFAFQAAIKKSEDDVEIRYQEAAAKVAKAEYEKMLESNRKAERSVTDVDVRRAKLEWDRSVLGIEKSQRDLVLAKFEADTKEAERDTTQLAIDRRTIRVPFDGEVVKLYRHQDEWVNPGDPIVRLVRLDTMEVEGAVAQRDYDPHEIQGCEVTVEVELARGRKEQATGRITYVSSLVRLDGKYLVRAEVTNRLDHGRWLLRDGMTASMLIHLNTASAAADVSRAR